jgi:hypothetical protein
MKTAHRRRLRKDVRTIQSKLLASVLQRFRIEDPFDPKEYALPLDDRLGIWIPTAKATEEFTLAAN